MRWTKAKCKWRQRRVNASNPNDAELERLRAENQRLKQEAAALRQQQPAETSAASVAAQSVSIERITDFVQALMANDALNHDWIPDFLEEKIDRRVLYLLLNALVHVLQSTRVEFVGHVLTFNISPAAAPNTAAAQREIEQETQDVENHARTLIEEE